MIAALFVLGPLVVGGVVGWITAGPVPARKTGRNAR